MTDKWTGQEAEKSNMEKDPDQWVTGDEPMTGAQRSYLKTLSEEAHEPFDENLTKAEASKRIEELQQITCRGVEKGEQSRSGTNPTESGGALYHFGSLIFAGLFNKTVSLCATYATASHSSRPRSCCG